MAPPSLASLGSDDLQEFERFVDGIGWPIDVRSHAGFLGGLDPHVSSGVYAPYWASSTTELLFHVVSRMPTQWMCAQQIAKKVNVPPPFTP